MKRTLEQKNAFKEPSSSKIKESDNQVQDKNQVLKLKYTIFLVFKFEAEDWKNEFKGKECWEKDKISTYIKCDLFN